MKTIVATTGAPRAIGPYSQGIVVDGTVYASGQIALDPATGTLVPGGIEEQTRRVLDNLEAVLDAAGSGMSRVVRATVYLVDMADFEAMNRVYGEYFREQAPARVTVAVAALPKGGRVEIDAIARV